MKCPRPRKQLLLKLGVFLLLGAIVNVAVASACAIYAPDRTAIRNVESTKLWIGDTQPGFPRGQVFGTDWVGFGVIRRYRHSDEIIWVNQWQQDGLRYCELNVSAGWPMHAVHGTKWTSISTVSTKKTLVATQNDEAIPFGDHSQGLGWRLLPTRVIWCGLVINTIFYGAILWLLWITTGRVRRFILVKRHRCPACGYQIDSAPGIGPRCSECGAALPAAWNSNSS